MVVCICKEIKQKEIAEYLAQGKKLSELIEELEIGSRCGCCMPYVESLVEEHESNNSR